MTYDPRVEFPHWLASTLADAEHWQAVNVRDAGQVLGLAVVGGAATANDEALRRWAQSLQMAGAALRHAADVLGWMVEAGQAETAWQIVVARLGRSTDGTAE